MPKPLPEQAYLKERFYYNTETGDLTWRVPPAQSKANYGDTYGSVTSTRGSNGTKTYRMGRLLGVDFYAHRLIWMWMNGEDPGNKIVDHKNGDGLDNSWKNLRLLTRGQNVANQPGHRRRKTPHKGVYRHKKGWIAQVRRGGKLYSSKVVGSSAEAKVLYDELITKLDS
jgi:hypothetical protein